MNSENTFECCMTFPLFNGPYFRCILCLHTCIHALVQLFACPRPCILCYSKSLLVCTGHVWPKWLGSSLVLLVCLSPLSTLSRRGIKEMQKRQARSVHIGSCTSTWFVCSDWWRPTRLKRLTPVYSLLRDGSTTSRSAWCGHGVVMVWSHSVVFPSSALSLQAELGLQYVIDHLVVPNAPHDS